MKITEARPTVFLRQGAGDTLEQRVFVSVELSESFAGGSLLASIDGQHLETPLDSFAAGDSEIEAWIPEARNAGEATFEIRSDGQALASHRQQWSVPRRWEVHVIQRSHHDVGYTDLASHVLQQHALWLEQFLEMAKGTDQYPEEARARLVVEQAWSIEHFLKSAPRASVDEMAKRIRAGDVELTAMFGNMATELCGHETLVRTLYAANRIAGEIGTEIITAEHNDIPGMVWGLSEILIDAGVKLFCPAIALFYGWSGAGYPSFWDEKAVFGREGMPGAFWWESPSGRRLLLWCNNHGCNGEKDPLLPSLATQLLSFEERGYPWSLMRWPVNGGSRDNSHYIDFYGPIREWNEKWAYPRLISSTNAIFYESFRKLPLDDLPVHRGDMTGQDYPPGASSTALATAVNRSNHIETTRAEALASLASGITGWKYPADTLRRAHEETLWHDEHTWGHHFPCGPTCMTSELEKAVHAYRGATLAHDVVNKAMARIADRVRLDQEGIHLVVFNPSPYQRTDLVSAMLREIENCGSELMHVESADPNGAGFWKPVVLEERWHVNPDLDIVNGKFRLIHVESGEPVPFEIRELTSALEPVPYSGQRIGVGNGMARYGFFEVPTGLKRDLRFIAKDVPALGYQTYRLEPCESADAPESTDIVTSDNGIENAFYRIAVSEDGAVCSIYDKAMERELIDDSAQHAFGSLIVRCPDGSELVSRPTQKAEISRYALSAVIRLKCEVLGHPVIEQTLSLRSGVGRIDFGVGILKDPTPGLETVVIFPFDVPQGQFLLDEPLHVADPGKDRLPGAFSNRLVPQEWVSVCNDDIGILWSSLDAPTISIGSLWPHRVSPAHCGTPNDDLHLPPQSADDLRGGTLYSCICFNNMMTNFSVNQSGQLYFRYVIQSGPPCAGVEEGAVFGDQAVRPFASIFTKHPGARVLEPSQALLETDNRALRLLTFKKAEDGDGMILRLWNPTDKGIDANINLPQHKIDSVLVCNVVEKTGDEHIACEDHSIPVKISANAIQTLRIVCQQ